MNQGKLKRTKRTLKEIMALPPPVVPPIAENSKCPLCLARSGKKAMLESAPSLEDILFVGLTTGIGIGKTEAVDKRWCDGCREYIERTLELLNAVRPS